MKYLLLATLLTCALAAHAQDSVIQKIIADICPCTKTADPKTAFNDNSPLQECFIDALRHERVYLSHMAEQKYGYEAQTKFRGFVDSLFKQSVASAPIYCEDFAKLVEQLRMVYYHGSPDSLRQVLANYNRVTNRINGNYYYHRGMVYLLLGNYPKAFADADSATIIKPKDDQSWDLKEWAAELTGHYDDAMAAYNKLIAINPNNPGYMIIPGMIERRRRMGQK